VGGDGEELSHHEVLQRSVHSPAIARAIVTDLFKQAEVDQRTADTALLLTSEIVTNAVTHGRGAPTLAVRIGSVRIRISVTDSSDAEPTPVPAPPTTAVGGRGVFLVDRLATCWGVERTRTSAGKEVWFQIDRS
jgi:anti-sigma regulatory factor (Ser/Thr protein kinase)